MYMKKALAHIAIIFIFSLFQIACASKSVLPQLTQPTLNERLEKAFNPPWWYKGPVRTVYNNIYPPPWYQGSLDWMGTEVNQVCDAKTEAMAKAITSAASAAAARNSIAIIYGVVRIASTTGAVTYCRLRT